MTIVLLLLVAAVLGVYLHGTIKTMRAQQMKAKLEAQKLSEANRASARMAKALTQADEILSELVSTPLSNKDESLTKTSLPDTLPLKEAVKAPPPAKKPKKKSNRRRTKSKKK
jgi:hypothetical protein